VLLSESDYRYDAFGNRVEKKVDNNGDGAFDSTQRYALDGWKTGPQKSFVGLENWDVWADLNGATGNTLQTRYLRGDVVDQLFAQVSAGGSATWDLTDRLGSVRDVTDGNGAVTNSITYDGFGYVTPGTLPGRYGWTGREYDSETGLQYNRARYYD